MEFRRVLFRSNNLNPNNSLGTAATKLDGYLYVQGNTGQVGGNLIIGTTSSTAGTTIVPASDWATLISKMSTAQQHQNNTTFSQAQPTSGSIITYLSSIDTEITSLTTNKYSAYTVSSVAGTAFPNSSSWSSTSTKTFTVTFASALQANYFFNSGGRIVIQSNTNAITQSNAQTTWNSFTNTGYNYTYLSATSFTHSGTVGTFTRNVYTSGSGFNNLTTTPTTFLSLVDTGTGFTNYNNNVIQLNLSYSAPTLTATLILYDNDTNTIGKTNTGSTTAQINVGFPETTYLSNSWGSTTTANTVNTQA